MTDLTVEMPINKEGDGDKSKQSCRFHQHRPKGRGQGRTSQMKMLQFENPGKFMENFDPEKSSREMRKVTRRIYTEKRRGNRIYDDKGVLLASGHDICDCLEKNCVGCFYPCPKCGSTKCGPECRCNRCWSYIEVEVEGSNIKYTIEDALS